MNITTPLHPLTSLNRVADFTLLEPTSAMLPAGFDFAFGQIDAALLREYFSSRDLHAIGVFRCENVHIEGASILKIRDETLVANELNMHPDKVVRALQQQPFCSERTIRRIKEPCALIIGPGHNVFGHWIADFLPKISLISYAGFDIDQIKIV